MSVNVRTTGEEALRNHLDRLRAEADELDRALDELTTPSRRRAAAVFAEELDGMLGEEDDVDDTLVRRAARIALAEIAWRGHLGTLLRTREVAELLAVSKQRVSTLAAAKRLIALRAADGSVGYPAWQFADGRLVEPVVAAHAALSENASEWSAASWCVEPHPELDDHSPAQWAAERRDSGRLALVARRDAARLTA